MRRQRDYQKIWVPIAAVLSVWLAAAIVYICT